MSEAEYVFPNVWGGVNKQPTPPQISVKMLELRKQIKSLAAEKKAGVMFPVRGAKDLNQKLANALNDLDLLAHVHASEFTHGEATPPSPDGKVKYRTLVHCRTTVRMSAPDGSFIDMVGSGHGADPDDKAGGKASTYAWKDAILKGLTIPHEDMIDTDDDSGDGPSSAAAKSQAARDVPKREPAASVPVPVPAGGSYVARIQAAASHADLAALQAEIKSGDVKLVGKERLDAAAAFVLRQKELGA